MTDDRADHGAWPARGFILLALGGILGLTFHALVRTDGFGWTEEPLRLAGAAFVSVGGFVLAFTLERLRWAWSILFALGCGLVAGAITYWNGGPEGWRIPSVLLAIAIAAPLFQVVRDEGRWRLVQRPIHAHAWSNVVLWFAAWLFVGLVFLLVMLLGQLFSLIGMDFLHELLRKGWFGWMLTGASLGAAIGLLRDRDRILGLLQRVVTVILSMLSPFLAIGLGVFLLSLPVTGLAPLWNETSATTPILLSCAVIAVLFANATIGNAADEEASHRALRYAGFVLALVVLPLAVVAAVSTGLRIGQHGLTPDRLWAATFVLVAVGYGAAYLVALALGRSRWPDQIRRFNISLALGLCVLALLLATPLIDFGAWSTRNQLGRLEGGAVTTEQFDWAALAFDFGPEGREALENLRRQGKSEAIRSEAAQALALNSKWEAATPRERAERRDALASLRVIPQQVAIPEGLRAQIGRSFRMCGREDGCVLLFEQGADTATLVGRPACIRSSSAAGEEDRPRPIVVETSPYDVPCRTLVTTYRLADGTWASEKRAASKAERERIAALVARGWAADDLEVREVSRRQLFIGGEPVSEVFE